MSYYFYFVGNSSLDFSYIEKRFWRLGVGGLRSINEFIKRLVTGSWCRGKWTLGVVLSKGDWDWTNCASMCVSVDLYIDFCNIYISEWMACSWLLWSSLSSLIGRWKGLPFCFCSSIGDMEVSPFFLFEIRSDWLLIAKVTQQNVPH